jgi:hypothetical protein
MPEMTLPYLAENGMTGNTGVNINELFKGGTYGLYPIYVDIVSRKLVAGPRIQGTFGRSTKFPGNFRKREQISQTLRPGTR